MFDSSIPRRIVDEQVMDTIETEIRVSVEAWELDDNTHVAYPLVGVTTTTFSLAGQPRIVSETTVTASNWDDLR